MATSHRLKDRAKEWTMDLADRAMSWVPRSKPSRELLTSARVLAHRGVHDEKSIENTISAFDRAVDLGVWGIEFDIRWTSDNVPVVHHDRDCLRTFGDTHVLENHPFAELRAKFPLIPSLSEVVARYRDRVHLMIELKKTESGWSDERIARISRELEGLESIADYHLMSLDENLLLRCQFAKRAALLPVAEFNAEALSEVVLREKMAGLTGHYMLLNSSQVERHRKAEQNVGTGFITSKSVLYREIQRGVNWIYTNHPEQTLRWLRD